jgi:hypothetical protein
VQEIATVLMNGRDEAVNLVVFNAERFLMNGPQVKVRQNSDYPAIPRFK